MKQVFTILKLISFFSVLHTLVALIFASYEIDIIAYPTLGGSITTAGGTLAITYTNLGYKYFTKAFRIMLGLNILTFALEQLDIIFNLFTRVQFINITLAFISVAFLSGLFSAIVAKSNR